MIHLNKNFTANLQYLFSKILIVFCLFVFSDCKRTTKDLDFFGPAYRVAPANFSVTGNSFTCNKSSVNFNKVVGNGFDSVFFKATFSDSVSWTITLTQASGAMKVITGLSNKIDQFNAKWNGSSSNIYFFKRKELVTAVISFLGSDIKLTTTLDILQVFLYNGKTINGVKYTLLDDFDGGSAFVNGTSTKLTGSTYPDLQDINIVSDFDSLIKIQGKFSYMMSGTDLNKNSYLAGMNEEPLLALYVVGEMLTVTDPNDLFVNLYIYGTGKPNSAIEIKAYELDTLSNASIPGYVYDQKYNDGWLNDIIIDWTGWKLVQLNYSKFQRARDPKMGGSGNGIKEPNKITGFAASLLSQPVIGASVDLRFDYVILSEHGTFTPR